MINEKPIRPSYKIYFMNICREVATRSTCVRHHVGAIITKNKRILATGYNGAPAGLPHCIDIGCPRKDMPSGTMHELCRAVHAEQNAIIQAALHGISTEGATLYCTHQPCILCSKMIINAGITEITYDEQYNDKSGLEMLKQAGIKITKYNYYEEIDKIKINEHSPISHKYLQSYCPIKEGDEELHSPMIHTHTHIFSQCNYPDFSQCNYPDISPESYPLFVLEYKYKSPSLHLEPPSFHLGPLSLDQNHGECTRINEHSMIDCQNVPIPAWKKAEIKKQGDSK